MISIYMCEDNEVQLKNWSKIITNYLLMNRFDTKLIYKTTSGSELLNHLEKEPPQVGLYFLDIDLNEELNGLALASEIKRIDPGGYIVFITTHSEMCYMTFHYKIGALDFILKEQESELSARIIQCITAALENQRNLKKKTTQFLSIKIENEYIRLDVSNILYIEVAPTVHKVLIHNQTGVMSIYHTLKNLESTLNTSNPQKFYRCNKSVLVNMDYVITLNMKEKNVILSNETTLPVSNRYLKTLKGGFIENVR